MHNKNIYLTTFLCILTNGLAHYVKTEEEGGFGFMRKNKLMSKIGAVALSAAMVACSLVIVPANNVEAAGADTSTGLIAHYSFENSLTNEANSGAATMNKGTAAYTDGVNGKAFDFSANAGTSQLANAATVIALDTLPKTTAFSVSYWVKHSDIAGSTMMFFDGCCQYFQFGSNGLGAFPMARASMSSDWTWDNVVGDHWRTGKATQATDTWQMVTYTVSSTGKATTYLNGVAVSEYFDETDYTDDGWFAYSLDNGATYKNMFSDGGEWVDLGFIGSGDWWNANYSGLMDEVYIYERELTAEDVAALYVADGPKTTSIEFAETNATSILVGQSATLAYSTAPAGAVDTPVITFASSDDKIATVDNTGKVTAVGKGTATITASLENGLKATVDVTVVKTIKVTTEIDCTGWWTAHTTGVEITKEGVSLTFKNTTYDTATSNWNGPIYVLYTGNEPIVNGDGYTEYAVMRGDLYGWTPTCNTNETDKWTAEGHTFTANGAEMTEADWANYLSNLKAGQECKVTAKLVNGGVQVKMTVGKAVSTATYKVDTTKPVYLSLGGELTKLTNIQATSMGGASNTADTAPVIPVVIVGCVAAAAVLVAKKRRVTE